MTARRKPPIFVDELRFSTRLRGPVRVVVPALRRLGIAWSWDARTTAFLVPKQRADDVLVALELAGHRVEIVGGDRLW